MHKHLLAGVSAIAVLLGGVSYGQDLMFAKGEGGFNWKSLEDFKASHTGLEGQTLSLWNAWNEPGDKAQWEAVLAYFADATGVVLQNGSSKNYEEQARIDIAAGSPANITILPQPGLLADFAKQGALVDLGDDTTKWLEENYSAGSSWAPRPRCRAPRAASWNSCAATRCRSPAPGSA